MDIYVYLKLEKYLAEWYIHENGGQPVVLKKGCAESDILELFLQKQPQDKPVDLGREANVSIRIPSYKWKDPRVYNYLPPKAKIALAHTIYTRFRVQLWRDLHRLDNTDAPVTDLIYAWMEAHGIEDDGKAWETIRQHYLRKRNSYRKLQKNESTSEACGNNTEKLL